MKLYYLKLVLVVLGFAMVTPILHASPANGNDDSNTPKGEKSSVYTEQEGTIPRRLSRKFRRDAARLALRMESNKEDLRYLNIVIPKDNIESIFSVYEKRKSKKGNHDNHVALKSSVNTIS